MLFAKKTPEEKMAKLLQKRDWSELSQYVYDDKETKLALANVLAASNDMSSVDILLRLVDDKDEDVIIATCETLKKVGTDHATADLQQILLRTPKDNVKLRQELSSTIQILHKKH